MNALFFCSFSSSIMLVCFCLLGVRSQTTFLHPFNAFPWLVFDLLPLLLVGLGLLLDNGETVDKSVFVRMTFGMLEGLVCFVICATAAAASITA